MMKMTLMMEMMKMMMMMMMEMTMKKMMVMVVDKEGDQELAAELAIPVTSFLQDSTGMLAPS